MGTFTDERDGQTYRTVKIGGKVWMAQNLNYKTDNSWCYNYDDDNGDKYGRLYTWDSAKIACPDGWHLPSSDEWDDLISTVGGFDKAGNRLKAKDGWKYNYDNYTPGDGNNKYRFSALPGGFRIPRGGFDSIGSFGYWWTATECGYDEKSHNRDMGYDGGYVIRGRSEKDFGFSVRCVSDGINKINEPSIHHVSRRGRLYKYTI